MTMFTWNESPGFTVGVDGLTTRLVPPSALAGSGASARPPSNTATANSASSRLGRMVLPLSLGRAWNIRRLGISWCWELGRVRDNFGRGRRRGEERLVDRQLRRDESTAAADQDKSRDAQAKLERKD